MTTQFVTSFIPYCDSQSPLVTLNIARGSDFYSRQRVAWNCWKVVEVPIDITQVQPTGPATPCTQITRDCRVFPSKKG